MWPFKGRAPDHRRKLEAAGAEWRPHKSATEKFSAMFPGEVNRRFSGGFGGSADDGQSPGTAVYSCEVPGALYQVSVTRVRQYFGSAEEFLQTVLDEMAQGLIDGILIQNQKAPFEGCPATSFEMRFLKGHSLSILGVAALYRNTVYVVSTAFPVDTINHFARFRDGFAIDRE
ncbi:MAG TPA: hypothetical protein VF515_17750 [Candidatus Binatia bacterium]